MNIQQFQYILAVVDMKNFEEAAEKCHVTQSTLSTMIGKFEKEIGVKIFNRKTKPVSITSEGKEIIKRLRILMNDIDALNNVIQELKGEMEGELKIGIIPTITPYLLPLFLAEFVALFPKIKVIIKEMTTAEIQKALKTRTIDIGILALPLLDNEIVEISLYSEPFLVYDCTGEQTASKIGVKELDYSKLLLLQEGHCLRTQAMRICELSDQLSNNINFEFESGSMESLVRITQKSKGITILPYLASLDLDEKESDKLLWFTEPVPVRDIGIVTHDFFVKKVLLDKLQNIIQTTVKKLLPEIVTQKIVNPL